MMYFAALALIGFACATALRWPVMFCAAALIAVVSFTTLLLQGAGLAAALGQGLGSLVVLQLCYVLGGAVLSLRLRRLESKKNLQA